MEHIVWRASKPAFHDRSMTFLSPANRFRKPAVLKSCLRRPTANGDAQWAHSAMFEIATIVARKG
ncbi:Hypothetical protein BN69_1241 [Methylocystis sp. SC2]|nr:Hypothetical protein BN69_1241 [Methylocystis sp. SC2]